MPGVLLILSNVRMDPAVIERAISEAKDRGEHLVVFAPVDPSIASKVAGQFLESGSIGPRTSEGLHATLSQRHEQILRQLADEVVGDARAAGVEARAVVRCGDYNDTTAAIVSDERPSAVVTEKRPRSLLRFLVADTFLDDLAARIGFRLIEV